MVFLFMVWSPATLQYPVDIIIILHGREGNDDKMAGYWDKKTTQKKNVSLRNSMIRYCPKNASINLSLTIAYIL